MVQAGPDAGSRLNLSRLESRFTNVVRQADSAPAGSPPGPATPGDAVVAEGVRATAEAARPRGERTVKVTEDALKRKRLNLEAKKASSETPAAKPIDIAQSDLSNAGVTNGILDNLAHNKRAGIGDSSAFGEADGAFLDLSAERDGLLKKEGELAREMTEYAMDEHGRSTAVSETVSGRVTQEAQGEKTVYKDDKGTEIDETAFLANEAKKIGKKKFRRETVPAVVEQREPDSTTIAFHPEKAKAVQQAKAELDRLTNQTREANTQLDRASGSGTLKIEYEMMKLLRMGSMTSPAGTSSNPEEIGERIAAIKATETQAAQDSLAELRDLAGKIRLDSDMSAQGQDLTTIEGIGRYLQARLTDDRLRGYAKLAQSAEELEGRRANAEEVHKNALEKSNRWKVETDGSETGEGFREVETAQAELKAVEDSLAGEVIFKTLIGKEYSPTDSEKELISGHQTTISRLDSSIADLEIFIKNQTDNSEPAAQAIVEANRTALEKHQQTRRELIEEIRAVVDPISRIKATVAKIEGMQYSAVSKELAPYGLSVPEEALGEYLTAVKGAVQSVIHDIESGTGTPSQEEVFRRIVDTLRGGAATPVVREPGSTPGPGEEVGTTGAAPTEGEAAGGGRDVPELFANPTKDEVVDALHTMSGASANSINVANDHVSNNADFYRARLNGYGAMGEEARKKLGSQLLEVLQQTKNINSRDQRQVLYTKLNISQEDTGFLECLWGLGWTSKEMINLAKELAGKNDGHGLDLLGGAGILLMMSDALFKDETVTSQEGGESVGH